MLMEEERGVAEGEELDAQEQGEPDGLALEVPGALESRETSVRKTDSRGK